MVHGQFFKKQRCKEALILHIQAFKRCRPFVHLWVRMEKSLCFCVWLPVLPLVCVHTTDSDRETQAEFPMPFYWHIKLPRKSDLANELWWIKSIWSWSVSLDCLYMVFKGEQSIKRQEPTASWIPGSHTLFLKTTKVLQCPIKIISGRVVLFLVAFSVETER